MRNKLFVLCLLVLLALIPRLWRINTDLQIHFDQGLHSLAAWNIWHEGKLSLLGHQTDTDGIFHAPIYYWFMIPSYWLGGGEPAYAAIWQILLNSLAVVGVVYLGKSLYDEKTGYVAGVLYAVSYGFASYDRWLSNVTPITWAAIVFAVAGWKLFNGKIKYLPHAAFMLAFISQCNGALGFFLHPVLLWLVVKNNNWKHISKKLLLLSVVAYFALHAPLIAFELKHNFVVLRAIAMFGSSGDGAQFSYETIVGNGKILFLEIVKRISDPYLWISALLMLGSVITLLRTFKQKSSKFIIGYVVLFFTATGLYKRGAIGFFYVPLLPVILIAISSFITSVSKNVGYAIIGALVVINISSWGYFLRPTHALTPIGTANLLTNQDRKNVVDWMYAKSKGESFSVWIYTIPYFLDDPWTYYFTWYGKNKYGYVPEKSGSFSPSDLKTSQMFFNVYEPDENRPFRLSTWQEEVVSNFGPVEDTFRSHDAIVDQRIWRR